MNSRKKKFELTDSLRLILDKISPSPEELAENVFKEIQIKLPNLDDYSLLAFCVIFIGKLSQSKAEHLQPSAKSLYILFNYAHYLNIYEKWQGETLTTTDKESIKKDGSNHGPQDISNDTSIEQMVNDIPTKTLNQ